MCILNTQTLTHGTCTISTRVLTDSIPLVSLVSGSSLLSCEFTDSLFFVPALVFFDVAYVCVCVIMDNVYIKHSNPNPWHLYN